MSDLEPPAWEGFVIRVVQLLQDDEELHAAAVRVLDSHAHAEEARADHEHALAERARR